MVFDFDRDDEERWSLQKTVFLALSCAASMFLSACVSDADDIHQWMTEQGQLIKPNVKPIAEPKQFVPLDYTGNSLIDPFDSRKLMIALLGDRKSPNSALAEKEQNRRKQPLEAYALDTMAMVGSLQKNGKLVALVKVDDLLYQVVPGNYMGQNFGLVKSVEEQRIVLREIVQDAAGEWIERTATLELQEK